MELELAATEDGSLSLRDPATGELQHNRAGAYSEALVNYSQPCGIWHRDCKVKHELRVLDVCFGLGYNTFVLLTELARRVPDCFNKVSIVAVENDPRVLKLIPRILQYHKFADLNSVLLWPDVFDDSTSLRFQYGSMQVDLTIRMEDARAVIPRLANNSMQRDVIFHDPFSAKHVPELWTTDLFDCYYKMLLSANGRVLTYSAASGVRGSLWEAGFYLWRSTGLGGKSGGTVGTIIEFVGADTDCIFPLTTEELAHLQSVSGVPYRDLEFRSTRKEIWDRRSTEQTKHRERPK